MRFSRNWAFITPEEQERMANFTIFAAGCGLNSLTLECLLRLGFRSFVLWDGDEVELSNLNRQDFEESDIGAPKVYMLHRRLKSIDPEARVEARPSYLTPENLTEAMTGANIVLNTVDFDRDEANASLSVNRIARAQGIPVISPFNLSLGGFSFVFSPGSLSLDEYIAENPIQGEPVQYFLELALTRLQSRSRLPSWLRNLLQRYGERRGDYGYDPQMAPGSFITAGYVSLLIFSIFRGETVPLFPEPVFFNGSFSRL